MSALLTSTPAAVALNETSGFGVYVHWPFCAAKCPYCDFNSHVRFGGVDEARFRAALVTELGTLSKRAAARKVTSIFFGGGTPSLMSPATVGAIIDAVSGHFSVAADAEITLEANPSSVEAGRFAGYRTAGVNRVSLGVQALRDAELKTLGRIHSVAEARTAIAIAAATFDRFTFDLIYARPGQSLADWRAELTEALAMASSHLSLYQLAIEPETPFAALHAAGKLVVPDDDTAAALYDLTQDLTQARGLPAYEVSNHAAPGEESRHNLTYWRYGAYLGIGPGAHGRVRGHCGELAATVTQRNPEAWAARVEAEGHGLVEDTPVTPAEQADEMLLMGLRLVEGLDLAALRAVTGFEIAASAVDHLIGLGLIDRPAPMRLRAIGRGRFILNALVAELAAGLAPAR